MGFRSHGPKSYLPSDGTTPNKSPLQILEKRERGPSQIFRVPPILSQERVKLLQIWQVYSQGPSEQNPFRNLGEKGAWAYPGTAQFFEYNYYLRNR